MALAEVAVGSGCSDFTLRRRPAGRRAQSESSPASLARVRLCVCVRARDAGQSTCPLATPSNRVSGSISRDIKVGIKTWIGLPSPLAALKSLIRGDI